MSTPSDKLEAILDRVPCDNAGTDQEIREMNTQLDRMLQLASSMGEPWASVATRAVLAYVRAWAGSMGAPVPTRKPRATRGPL